VKSEEDGMNARRLGRFLVMGALALLLAGCFRVNMNIEVTPEDTVSGTAIIAVDESLLELSGQTADQLFKDMDLSSLPAGATTDRYQEDGFVGQTITFEEVPLAEFTGNNALSGSGGGSGDELNIVREGDEFHVTGAFDMSGPEFTGTEVPQQFLESFEFKISIKFPGEVKSATGAIDGNTVTWEPKFGENTRVEAVASAIPSASSPLLMILLIAVGALVLGAIAFMLTHRKTPAPAAGWTGDGTTMPVEADPPAMPEGPIEPVAPIEPPPPPAAPATPIEAAPFPPESPGAAIPPEDEPPAPPASD
jgi:phosphatidylinositol mannoside-binding LppM-like protein